MKSRLLLVLMTLTSLPLLAMEPSSKSSSKQYSQDIKSQILLYIDNAPTIEEVVAMIQEKYHSPKWEPLLSDPLFTREILRRLVAKSPSMTLYSLIVAAILLRTQGAINWLATVPHWQEQAIRLAEIRLRALERESFPLESSSAQAIDILLNAPEIADYFAKKYKTDSSTTLLFELIHQAGNVEGGNLSIIEKLIDANADLNFRDCNGRTALMIVVQKLFDLKQEIRTLQEIAKPQTKEEKGKGGAKTYFAILDLLLANKADPNVKDNAGKTALNYALAPVVFQEKPTEETLIERMMKEKRTLWIANKLIKAGAQPDAHDALVLRILRKEI